MKPYFRPLLLLILFTAPLGVQAELFKWVDENGKIHYSDKKPDDTVQSKVIGDRSDSQNQSLTDSGSRPIIRPYEKTARKLHLLNTQYVWKRETEVNRSNKLGAYYTGKGCISRGAIRTPEVFIHHKPMIPAESRLTQQISRIINGLDYSSERTEKYRLLERLKKTGGLSLHSEIIQMNLSSCAPGVSQGQRRVEVSRIPARRFTKHRVNLEVSWRLKTNRDQDLVYETVTDGGFSGWNQSMPASEAIGNALENAVLKLFADADFIARILVDGQGATRKTPSNPQPSLGRKYVLQAYLAKVFTEVNLLKNGSVQHFMMQGEWPDGLSALGYSQSLFNDSETIAYVNLQPDGNIVVELKEMFGNDKMLTLSPVLDDSGEMVMSRWRCSSNLDAAYLPQSCESR